MTAKRKLPIVPEAMARPMAAYSPGLQCGSMLFVSGMLSLNQAGNVVGKGDVTAQTEQVIDNIRLVLEKAGGTLEDVVMMQIFLRSFSDYAEMNKVYAKYFGGQPPARFCVSADLVAPDFLVEMAAIAMLDK